MESDAENHFQEDMSHPLPPTPPRWAERLLEWYCDPYMLEDLQGDLYERFYERLEHMGQRRARLLYVWDVLRFIKPYVMKKRDHPAAFLFLLRSYIQVATRHLLKYKVNTAISVSGLATGITCFILIMLYVQDEALYDKHYDKAERIFRVTTRLRSQTANEHVAWANSELGHAAKERYAEVEEAVGLIRVMGNGTAVRSDHGTWREANLYLTESGYFKVFSHDWIQGNPETALLHPNSIVLTESLARKYFPGENAYQKILTVGGNEVVVSGILEDLPDHTDLKFDALLSNDKPLWEEDNWCTTYLLFTAPEKAAGFDAKLDTLYQEGLEATMQDANTEASYVLEPLTDVHFGERKIFDTPKSDRANQYIFTAVAIGILLIAAINYINLSIARIARRKVETGLRKTMGALRSQIHAQYLTESVMVATISLALALALTAWLLPLLNRITGKAISVGQLFSLEALPMALLIVVVIGLLAGSYPALKLASGNAAANLRSDAAVAGRNTLQHVLIVIQFTASITLMVCSTVVYNQVQLLTDTNPGFTREQTLVVDIPGEPSVCKAMPAFKNALVAQTFVVASSVTGFNSVPASDMDIDTYEVMVNGETTMMPFSNISVDEDYLRLLDIDVVSGRSFTPADLEANDAIMVNEAFVKQLGWEHPVDQKVFCGSFEGRVIGVVKDFYFSGLHKTVEPLLLHGNVAYPDKLLVRLAKADFNTITALENVWRGTFKDQPFTVAFLDVAFSSQYQSERTLQTILFYFSVLTVVVACLGLFGLIAILATRKTREFGIRKVFGASRADLTFILWKPFLLRILFAALLSVPLTYFGMQQWLQRFSNQTDIGPMPFVVASCGACLLAVLAMSYHSFQTARTNPVNSIRHD